MKPTIAACLIVKNEEHFLAGCLESIRNCVDEIIVVDTGSTDLTVDIAKEFGAKIFQFPWNGNFSAARNESVRQCTTDWVLSIDADERLEIGSKEKIDAVIVSKERYAVSVLIQGQHHLASGVVEQVNAYPRIFRRHPKIFFEGVVHEQILPSLQRMGKSVSQSDIVIHHLGYGESLEKVREKSVRNIKLLEAQLAASAEDDYARYQIGNSYVVLQEYDSARGYLERVVESSEVNKSIKASASNLLVEVELSKMNIDRAEQWCRRSLEFVQNQTMARWFLSGILAHNGNFTESLQLIKSLRMASNVPTGLAHDLVISANQMDERSLLCYEMLAKNSVSSFDLIAAEKWINEAEGKDLRSIELEKVGVEVSLAKKDILGAYPRLKYLVDHLPATANEQRAKFSSIKAKLEQMVAFEISS